MRLTGNRLAWARIIAEAVAIVVSILLAFGIDSWWDARTARAREAALLDRLRTDFESNQVQLDQWTQINAKLVRAMEAFLAQITGAQGGERMMIPDSLLAAVVVSPTYDPSTATLDAVVSAGLMDLLRSQDLQRQLAEWRPLLQDLRENELAVRDVVHRLTVPILARDVSLRAAADSAIAWSLSTPELELASLQVVRASTELEGALALQLLNTRFVTSGLEELRKVQAAVLRELDTAARN